MLKPFFIRLAGAFGLSVLTIFAAMAQGEAELVKALNQQLIPINVSPTDTNFIDLDKLKPFIKDKQVFALGEATHGTHEFFAFKHRMLEFLVKGIGIKTFVIEADFAGTRVMNDYVLYGKGDAMRGLAGMGIGVWMTREVVDMANWIKAYNSKQTVENKVQFLGCDMQWGSSAMQLLKEYLQPRGRFTPVMEEGFIAANKFLPSINNADKAKIKNAIKALSAVDFDDADSSRVALNKHYVRELQQFVDLMDAKSVLFPAKQDDVRDKYMAENCMWI